MKKTTKLTALLLTLLLLFSVVVTSLVSCFGGGDDNGGNGGGGNNDGGNDGNGDSGSGGGNDDPGASVTGKYNVSITSAGGLALGEVSIYVYPYSNGEPDLNNMIDFGMTDADGKASLTLEANGLYAVMLDAPEGYAVEEYYPLAGENTAIALTSSVIKDADMNGKLFNVGDIMYDFTVLKDNGEYYTLSEELKTHKMAVLNFWYTGCTWCISEFPFMEAVYKEDAFKDTVSLIALDPIDDMENIRFFKDTFDENYGEVLTFDMGKDDDSEITKTFAYNGVDNFGFPTTVVIDRYGMVSLVESGALPSERAFRIMFEHFTSDNYEQKIINSLDEITPRQKPNVQMPTSSDMSAAFDKGTLGNVTYRNDSKDEYSWPFIIDEKNGETCIKSSNKEQEDSYAQLFVDVTLEAGEALAFDYISATEHGADILYVLVDKKDIYSISGVNDEWRTCYAYVAEEAGTYELAFCYIKDGDTDTEDDTVWLKNLRKVDVEDIDSPTYIYRFAATNPNSSNIYQDYPELFLGADGYYHVESATGPILLADLMGTTRFDETNSAYYLCLGKSYEAALIKHCSYASNSQIYGLSPVTDELKGLLEDLAADCGEFDENAWLMFCCYYDSYGTDKELADPIKGLSLISAYSTIESAPVTGDEAIDFPNVITYDRVIMPRGLFYKFTPTVSGTYKITSYTEHEVNAWLFRAEDIENREAWLTYDNVYRPSEVDPKDANCYMMAYLEAGVDYYINIAFYDVYQYGTINFRVERLTSLDSVYENGEGYYRFTLASPGFFTYIETTTGDINKILAGGIDVELGNDGYWREKRTDGRVGSLLYADFTELSTIFSKVLYADDSALPDNKKIVDMIEARAFNFKISEDDLYILNYLDSVKGNKDACRQKLREIWGEDYDEYAELYKLEEVLAGIYHGKKNAVDLTDEVRSIVESDLIRVGSVIDGEVVEEGDVRIGCIVMNERLAEILQLLMDKYTFAGVTNSWTKLCYYSQYFCAATPK